jgi:hypothetical protein
MASFKLEKNISRQQTNISPEADGLLANRLVCLNASHGELFGLFQFFNPPVNCIHLLFKRI